MNMGMHMREYGYGFVKEHCRPTEVGYKIWEQLGGSMRIECRDPPPSLSLISTFTCVYERLASLTGGVHDDG